MTRLAIPCCGLSVADMPFYAAIAVFLSGRRLATMYEDECREPQRRTSILVPLARRGAGARVDLGELSRRWCAWNCEDVET